MKPKGPLDVGKTRTKLGKILFTREQIEARLDQLAAEIEQHYGKKELTVVAVLKGSLFFTADLVRRLDLPVRVDILEISTYFDGVAPSGRKELSSYLLRDVRGRHVLVVDDIVDTGGTLAEVVERLGHERPKSLATCVFLNRRRKRRLQVPIDFCGFEVGGRDFVVGYGLDYAQRYRNLPHLAVLNRKRPVKKRTRRKAAATKKKKTTRRPSARRKKTVRATSRQTRTKTKRGKS